MQSHTAETDHLQGSGRRRGGDLEIIEERVMVSIPRGDEELRVTFTRARTGDGKEIAWHSIRVFWKTDAGEWRAGKSGVTIRGRELRAVADALARACAGSLSDAGTSTPPGTTRPAQRSPSAEG
jgi:hypothetical protein